MEYIIPAALEPWQAGMRVRETAKHMSVRGI